MSRIAFYGAGDLAEIAYLSLQETNIELVAIVDDQKIGKRFMRLAVADPDRLGSFSFDRILITSVNSTELILQRLTALGISDDVVVQIN